MYVWLMYSTCDQLWFIFTLFDVTIYLHLRQIFIQFKSTMDRQVRIINGFSLVLNCFISKRVDYKFKYILFWHENFLLENPLGLFYF